MRSMVVYGSFLDATEDLPAKTFKEVWLAVLKYGIDGIEPGALSASAKMAFNLAKPNIDANKKRRKNPIDNNCEQLQTIVSKEVHFSIDGDGEYIDGDVDVDEDVNGDVDGDVEGDVDVEGERVRARAKRFAPPTVEEVRTYCEARQNDVDPEAFVAFYESKGWKVGREPMRNWKSAVITWEKRQKRDGQTGARSSPYIEAIQNRVKVVDSWV